MRKKKLFKKIVSSLLALTMVSAMVLTGCGNTAQQTIAETAEESETADRDVQTGDAQESATAASETGTNAAAGSPSARYLPTTRRPCVSRKS